ncbi:DUF3413 domain-containing protein [Thalassomonas sp. M1454]|uniref:DUF3413 domain-containing protein n=1 Tax=Thalassomonas sp. M1454 TaxID=2594477 RepID=UPI00117C297A|nr:DUF3413 domain-containing protein [Thalassomonas sp. M1454]TRX56865.1 DUF3413 domain-containing protein [Thalassomonas sp. M1454]
MVSNENSSYSKRLLHLISWGHWFTFFNIIAAILIAIIFLDAEGVPEGVIGKIYMLTNWFSHMAFLTFICFVLTVFPLTLLFPRTNFIRGAASVIFTAALTLLVLDGFTYSQLGYHLNISSTSQIVNLLKEQMRNNSMSFSGVAIFSFVAILIYELVVSNYAWRHLRELKNRRFPRFFVFGLIASFFVSHFIHVWADAKLEYNVLRQDTVLPYSYPATAKTLLTKYGLFNRDDYEQRKNSPISFNLEVPSYLEVTDQCQSQEKPKQSVILVLNEKTLSNNQIKQFKARSQVKPTQFFNHMDSAVNKNAWFNLFYSLPTIYKHGIYNQDKAPVLLQQLNTLEMESSLVSFIGDKEINSVPGNIERLFSDTQQHKDISEFVFADKLNGYAPGLQVFYFSGKSDYQYELFVNALLLAQQQKQTKDIIFISSIGNLSKESSFQNKPSLLIWPQRDAEKVTQLSSPMDIQPTLMRDWLKCDLTYGSYSSGKNLYRLRDDRIIANTMDSGLMVFKKDKTVFIDQQGNFESYSIHLETLISESSNFPLMIDGVQYINKFSKNNSTQTK